MKLVELFLDDIGVQCCGYGKNCLYLTTFLDKMRRILIFCYEVCDFTFQVLFCNNNLICQVLIFSMSSIDKYCKLKNLEKGMWPSLANVNHSIVIIIIVITENAIILKASTAKNGVNQALPENRLVMASGSVCRDGICSTNRNTTKYVIYITRPIVAPNLAQKHISLFRTALARIVSALNVLQLNWWRCLPLAARRHMRHIYINCMNLNNIASRYRTDAWIRARVHARLRACHFVVSALALRSLSLWFIAFERQCATTIRKRIE